MKVKNNMLLSFPSLSQNESFARQAVAAFALQVGDWTLVELDEIMTAVSEAVTNAIIHAYEQEIGEVRIRASILEGDGIEIIVEDDGIGIEDIEQAMEPMFTTKAQQERTGMGFSFMESFMHELTVTSTPNQGTSVRMVKWLTNQSNPQV
ncbi:MAG TPA: anti-sigma F factor [Firmicutes bacterium]|jgi:stage II sporulation protein AB (anti-sigma F factor)|nr:anti-sigma F factor [Bacillota bacterium]